MSITIAPESLYAPVPHVTLLEPGQALIASGSAYANAAVLTISLSVHAVAGAYLRILANGDTTR